MKKAESGVAQQMGQSGKLILILLGSVHLAIAAYILMNQVTHRAIYSEAEAFHMQYYYQFAQGDHCYYPRGTMLNRVSDTYTPLAAQIYGRVIKWVGHDVRAVRLTSGILGGSAIVLLGLIVFQLVRDRTLAFVAACLCAGMAPMWFMDVSQRQAGSVAGVAG